MPMVSIIVPIYNVEKYLRECIDSALAQTYSDFELILVDDGSPDNCAAICDEYARKDARIRVIHKANGGLSDARNAGLDAATGKYVYFLDSDDRIAPELLATTIPYMEHGCELVSFIHQCFYDDGTVEKLWKRKCGEFVMDTPEERQDFLHRRIVQSEIGWEAWSRVFVREIIERHHLRFADNRKIFAEDLYFSLCYCAHIRKAVSLDASLYGYRLRGDSIMGQQMRKNNIDRIEQLAQEVLKHYRQWEDCRLLVESFPFLHYQIIMKQFIFQIQYVEDPERFRADVISSLENWPQLREMICSQQAKTDLIREYYSPLNRFDLNRNTAFLLGGSPSMLKITNWVIQKIRNQQERLDRLRSIIKK